MHIETLLRHNTCMQPNLAKIGALIGDPARAAMLAALLGNKALPATELAQLAHITPQTASAHLGKLLAAGLISVRPIGRHRYFELAGPQVATALEALALIAPPATPSSLRESLAQRDLRHARTCYSHLAGRLGVALSQACLAQALLADHGDVYEITNAGIAWFGSALDLDVRGKLRFAKPCLDWSERVPHLGGALGVAVTAALFERGWLACKDNTRAVRITASGAQHFFGPLGITL
jgi:DNA-binding transcriptional ArsR family regulator